MPTYRGETFSAYNHPKRTPGERKEYAVLAKERGQVRLVRFGDPDMPNMAHVAKRRANFRARHNCDEPGSKLKARYWACKVW